MKGASVGVIPRRTWTRSPLRVLVLSRPRIWSLRIAFVLSTAFAFGVVGCSNDENYEVATNSPAMQFPGMVTPSTNDTVSWCRLSSSGDLLVHTWRGEPANSVRISDIAAGVSARISIGDSTTRVRGATFLAGGKAVVLNVARDGVWLSRLVRVDLQTWSSSALPGPYLANYRSLNAGPSANEVIYFRSVGDEMMSADQTLDPPFAYGAFSLSLERLGEDAEQSREVPFVGVAFDTPEFLGLAGQHVFVYAAGPVTGSVFREDLDTFQRDRGTFEANPLMNRVAGWKLPLGSSEWRMAQPLANGYLLEYLQVSGVSDQQDLVFAGPDGSGVPGAYLMLQRSPGLVPLTVTEGLSIGHPCISGDGSVVAAVARSSNGSELGLVVWTSPSFLPNFLGQSDLELNQQTHLEWRGL